ncbi:MAG: hypothetical protein JXB88_14265 [Spirochaetales bacterium]|nr:hypothetical protein [Spirochaetales bacterium]
MRHKFIILLIYFLAVIIYILSPMFHEGNICSTDFVSNIMRARFMNENLTHYLSLDRWTHMQYLGFQPFMFYFPGFFILINLIHMLSFGLISLTLAYKLLILASFLFLPVSIYFCMRTFGFKKVHSFFSSFFSLASGMVYGYGFTNLLCWGMDVAFFVISLLPAILALYHKFIKSDRLNLSSLFCLSLLFAGIAISHLQTALHFALVLFIYNIYIFYQVKDKLLYVRKNLLVLLVSCLLAGFWYYPVLRFYDFFGVLTTCEVDTLINRIINFLSGKYLTIQPVALLFVIGLFLLKSKSRKNRLLGFFPITALILFILAADYYARNVKSEFLHYLLNLFTTRSYAVFCLFISFIAGFALGEIILFIRKGKFLLFSKLRKKTDKKGLMKIVNYSFTGVSGIIIIALCVFFITVSLAYMLGFKDDIKTESVTAQNFKPGLLKEAFSWLKNNTGEYDLIGQQYQMEPIPDMSGAGYLVSLQDYTDLPVFGGGHFESSQIAMMMTQYDNENFFKSHNADYLHENLVKFNMKYIVIDNRQKFLDKLVQYKDGFEQVFANSLLTILKIKGTNSMFVSNPEQSGIKVIDFTSDLEKYNPGLSWKIDNEISGNEMTLSIAYFPKWKVSIDGKEINAQKNHDLLLTIPLEKRGEQTITIEYKTTFFEMFFTILSLVTLLFITGMCIRYVMIKRKDIMRLISSYWRNLLNRTALMHTIFLFSVAIMGSIVIFLTLSAMFSTPSVKVDAPDESGYNNTVWQFSYMMGNEKSTLSNNLTLLPDGKIDGYSSENEDHWAIENGILVFYSNKGVPTTRFTRSMIKDGRRILEGHFLLSENIIHILEQ